MKTIFLKEPALFIVGLVFALNVSACPDGSYYNAPDDSCSSKLPSITFRVPRRVRYMHGHISVHLVFTHPNAANSRDQRAELLVLPLG